jgi:hypothetical protein
MTYTELQAQIASAVHRTDLGTKIPDFIAAAEALLFRELNVKSLETSTTGTTSGGVIALPSDCASVGRVTMTVAGVETPLDYDGSPGYRSGQPMTYQLESGGLRLDSATDGYDYKLYYTPALTALSGSNPTNWLLTNAPDLYQSAAQLEAARWIRDYEQVQALTGVLSGLLDSTQRYINRCGQPLRGGMQIKPRN